MRSGLGVFAGDAAMPASPAQDVLGLPDLAHGQLDCRLGEVGPVHQLLDALATDVEQLADLGGSDEVVHGRKHRFKTTGHLTSAPAIRETSHVTIGDLTSGNATKTSRREEDRKLLTVISYKEYRALPGHERLERGWAAERERRRFSDSRLWADLHHRIRRGYECCAACGTGSDLTIDHVHPIVRGGSHDPENLQILCGSCNSRKRHRD